MAVLSSQAGLPAFRGPQDVPVFNNWAMNARPPANPKVKQLFENAKARGYETYFVTARDQAVEEGTKQVLSSAGYQGYTGLFHKPDGIKPAEWKAAIRKNLADQGIDISANVGDSATDFLGGFFRHKIDVAHLKGIQPTAASVMQERAKLLPAAPTPWAERTNKLQISRAKAAIRSLSPQERADPARRTAAILGTQKFYHGTDQPYLRPDFSKLKENSLFGPGYYTTNDWELARTYSTGIWANVRKAEVHSKRSLHLSNRRLFPKSVTEKLAGLLTDGSVTPTPFDSKDVARATLFAQGNAEHQYHYAAGRLNRPGIEGKVVLNNWLKQEGYDSITHVGGTRAGRNQLLHRVVIGLTDESAVNPAREDLPFVFQPAEEVEKSGIGELPQFRKKFILSETPMGKMNKGGVYPRVKFEVADMTPKELLLWKLEPQKVNPKVEHVVARNVYRGISQDKGDFWRAGTEPEFSNIKHELVRSKIRWASVTASRGQETGNGLYLADLRDFHREALHKSPRFIKRSAREVERVERRLSEGAAAHLTLGGYVNQGRQADAAAIRMGKSAAIKADKVLARQMMRVGEGAAASASTTGSFSSRILRGARRILSQI